MAWYRFIASHGPGHQSHSEEYQWLDNEALGEEINDKLLKELWDDWTEGYEWPIGKVELVDKLPEKAKQGLISKYKYEIEDAKEMLKIIINDQELYEKILNIDIKTFDALRKIFPQS